MSTERPHIEPHVRSIAVQTLDALLRIEEVMSEIRESLHFYGKAFVKVTAEGVEVIPAHDVEKPKRTRSK